MSPIYKIRLQYTTEEPRVVLTLSHQSTKFVFNTQLGELRILNAPNVVTNLQNSSSIHNLIKNTRIG